MKKTITKDKFKQMIMAFVINKRINYYAVERVAFGYEKPGDKAPIDLYLEHLRLNVDDLPNKRGDIPGAYIDENECIRAEQDYDEYVRDLFVEQMERLFCDAPKDVDLERSGEEMPFERHLRAYLLGIFPLFAEIINTELDEDDADIFTEDNGWSMSGYGKWRTFVTDILLKPMTGGCQIDERFTDFTDMPYFVYELIEKKGENYYLKSVDTDSYEYIFALLSLMIFKNYKNYILLNLKMLEWERLHNRSGA